MPTTDIGPCECCGGAGGCPCTTCLYQWLDIGSGFDWQIIDFCGGGDGSSEPCCSCPPAVGVGTYDGEEQVQNCSQISPFTNKCDCTHCYATWNAFTQMWEAGVCLSADETSSYVNCNCSTALLSPGDEHGQMLYVICGCPA